MADASQVHVCGEYQHGFNAALAIARERLEVSYDQVRDGPPYQRADILRMLTNLLKTLEDKSDHRPERCRGGRKKAA